MMPEEMEISSTGRFLLTAEKERDQLLTSMHIRPNLASRVVVGRVPVYFPVLGPVEPPSISIKLTLYISSPSKPLFSSPVNLPQLLSKRSQLLKERKS